MAQFQSGYGIASLQIEEAGSFPVCGGNGLRGFASRYTHDGDCALIGCQGALCGNINFASRKFFASEHAGILISIRNRQPKLAGSRTHKEPLRTSASERRAAKTCREFRAKHGTSYHRQLTLESEIDLLREYRSRLVSDVVTGKLEVCEAVAQLPDEATAETSEEPVDEIDEADPAELTDEGAEA